MAAISHNPFLVQKPGTQSVKRFASFKAASNYAIKLSKEDFTTVSVMEDYGEVFPRTKAFVHPNGRIEMRNPKSKSGPISSATRMITGVGEYILTPVTRLGSKADKQIGRVIGHNPGPSSEKFGRESEAKAYKRLVEAEGYKARVEFEPDMKGVEKWVVRVTKANPTDFDSKMAAYARRMSVISKSKDVDALERLVAEMEEYRNSHNLELPINYKIIDAAIQQSYSTLRQVKRNPDPAFTSKAAAQKYARLIQHELTDGEQARVEQSGRDWVVRTGWPVMHRNPKKVTKAQVTQAAGQLQSMQRAYGDNNMATQRAWSTWFDLQRAWDAQKAEEKERKTKGNPESDAASMYEKFHGKPSESIATFEEEEHYHGHLAELGQLIELKVCTITGLDATFCFDYKGKPEKGVILASNEDGTQLYFVGGDQSLKLADIKMDKEEWLKDSMVIGDAYFVSYFTEKDFDKFQPTIYEHELGEETGDLPVLRYDRLNGRLYLDGGCYVIKKPLMRTSDGIEN